MDYIELKPGAALLKSTTELEAERGSVVINEAEIRRQVEREFEEPVQRRATIYFCDWCKERIRFGEMCVVEEVTGAKVSKEVHVHARCYGDWIAKEGR